MVRTGITISIVLGIAGTIAILGLFAIESQETSVSRNDNGKTEIGSQELLLECNELGIPEIECTEQSKLEKQELVEECNELGIPEIECTEQSKLEKKNEQDRKESEYELWKITLDGIPLTVEIADDREKITQGLMFRDGLLENQGMLFPFEEEGKYQFWMMNMKFDLDILWLDGNGKVVYIAEDAQPCIDEAHTSLCTYRTDTPAKYVLEVNSGFVEKNGINENSVMKIIS